MNLDSKNLTKLIGDLDKFIRQRNTELSLQTLGLIRAGLGDRIVEDSKAENLRIYEEAQARMNAPKVEPSAIGGFEWVDCGLPKAVLELVNLRLDEESEQRFNKVVDELIDDGLIELRDIDVKPTEALKPKRGRPRKDVGQEDNVNES